jgi:integrase
MPAGIEVRHGRACRSHGGGRCSCKPGFRAVIFDAASGRKIAKTHPSMAAAKRWRAEAQLAVAAGRLSASATATLKQVAEQWLDDAEAGHVLARGGTRYKPSTVRQYRCNLQQHIYPDLGGRRLAAISRRDLQQLVDRLHREGKSASTVQSVVLPLRAIYRRRDDIPINPTVGLALPAVGRGRDRIADPAEAAALLRALPEEDRALWATAMYAGLRRGELMALRWSAIDLERRVLRVERGWDMVEGEIEPKSRESRRTVPIAAVLRPYLLRQRLRTGRDGDDLVFGDTPTAPFRPDSVRRRALKAWGWDKHGGPIKGRRQLEPIGLHECRHTFASLMIAAGVNAKALTTYMGHGSVQITFDRYGHLMPGNEAEAAGLLDAYLVAAGT